MIRVRTNAREIAARQLTRRERLGRAIRQGLRNILIAVNREQIRRLSGSGGSKPGAYPVPVRRGHLRRSAGWEIESQRSGVVVNTAVYAVPVHEGRGSSTKHGPRPFLHDAAADVDPMAIMAVPVGAAW